MSVRRLVAITCDHRDGCGAQSLLSPDGVHGARRLARSQGWFHMMGRDYCPSHRDSPGFGPVPHVRDTK